MIEYIIIIIILILIKSRSIHEYFTETYVISQNDQRSYKIAGGFTNSQQAADKMSELNNYIIKFLKFLKKKYIVENQGNIKEQEFVRRVITNYNPDVIFENNPRPGEDTSFVVNKGASFGICLRDKNKNDIHDDNILNFVIIHELTHMGTIGYGHEYEFWAWMKFMLKQAENAGLYIPVDYKKQKTSYCGIQVTHNPYYIKTYNHMLA